eukprot:12363212-Karenia_brevis.AAC.1
MQRAERSKIINSSTGFNSQDQANNCFQVVRHASPVLFDENCLNCSSSKASNSQELCEMCLKDFNSQNHRRLFKKNDFVDFLKNPVDADHASLVVFDAIHSDVQSRSLCKDSNCQEQ